jgi:2-oxoisovalerate dehydrogenase E1 component
VSDVASQPRSAGLPGGVPAEEAVADFRLACTARAIDEREMTLQKQQKVFFEISGAGHEALGLGFARALRPGYDWFFPYYRDLALVLGLGVTPEAVLLQAVGSAADPASGGRQMPSHWGDATRHIVTQSSPTGSQMPAARVRGGHALPRDPPRVRHRRRPCRRGHLRLPRRGLLQRG